MQGVANNVDWSPLPELESSARLSDRIGRRIENARRLRRMTQSELASKIGSTQQSVWLIENGYQSPRLSRLFDIARVLGTTVSDLAQGIDTKPAHNQEPPASPFPGPSHFSPASPPKVKKG